MIGTDIIKLGKLAQDPHKTYEKIGWKFGITAERVRQLLKENYPELIEQRKDARKLTCDICNGKFHKSYVHSNRGTMACTDCMKKLIKQYENNWCYQYPACIECGTTKRKHQALGMCYSCYGRYRYKIDPVRRAKRLANARRWAKNNPERRRIICLKATNKYLEKLRKDPVRYQEYLKKQRDRYKNRVNN